MSDFPWSIPPYLPGKESEEGKNRTPFLGVAEREREGGNRDMLMWLWWWGVSKCDRIRREKERKKWEEERTGYDDVDVVSFAERGKDERASMPLLRADYSTMQVTNIFKESRRQDRAVPHLQTFDLFPRKKDKKQSLDPNVFFCPVAIKMQLPLLFPLITLLGAIAIAPFFSQEINSPRLDRKGVEGGSSFPFSLFLVSFWERAGGTFGDRHREKKRRGGKKGRSK